MDKMAMGKCEDGQKKSFYNETNCEHFQGWYGGLQFGIIYTCNGLLQRMWEFEGAGSRAFFKSLLNNLSIKDLLTLGNLLFTKFINPWRQVYVTPSRQA